MLNRYSLIRCRHGLMACEEGDMIATLLRIYGEWAENSNQLLEQLIPANGTVIDVGANIGTLTLAFANRVGPSGRVLAFEAQQRVFYNLCTNLMLNNMHWVEARHCLISSTEDSTLLPIRQLDAAEHRSMNRGGIGFINTLLSPTQQQGESHMEIHRLDTYATSLESCDLIKVDTEGAEPLVLEGAKLTIEKFRPYLYLECGSEPLLNAIESQLNSANYQLFWHACPHYNPSNFRGLNNVTGNQGDLNILAVPEEKEAATDQQKPWSALPAVAHWQQVNELFPAFTF